MRILISIHEVPSGTGYVIEDAGWERMRRGGQAIAEMADCLTRLLRFLDDQQGESPPGTEASCLPQPRPCQPYYQIPACTEAGRLAETLPYHLGTALVYCLRAGKKPGASAEEDCRKAADHLLMEADRLRRIMEGQNG